MPFCRECGKEVEHDWVTCPFCSQTIGPPALNSPKVQDSIIMGDVNTSINDSDSISEAMRKALQCPECNSSGAILIGCKDCSEHVGCSNCIDDLVQARITLMNAGSEGFWTYSNDKAETETWRLFGESCKSCWEDVKEKRVQEFEAVRKIREEKIQKIIKQWVGVQCHVQFKDGTSATIYAPQNMISTLIGKGGENIRALQEELGGMHLNIKSFEDMTEGLSTPKKYSWEDDSGRRRKKKRR